MRGKFKFWPKNSFFVCVCTQKCARKTRSMLNKYTQKESRPAMRFDACAFFDSLFVFKVSLVLINV